MSNGGGVERRPCALQKRSYNASYITALIVAQCVIDSSAQLHMTMKTKEASSCTTHRSGASDGARTRDLRFTKPLLYH
jgi:hypothetical protein